VRESHDGRGCNSLRVTLTAGPTLNGAVFEFVAKTKEHRSIGSYSSSPGWSPAGDAIICDTESGGPSAIERVNIDGTRFRRLTPADGSVEPAWSPNGHKIAFSRVHRGGRDIFVMKSRWNRGQAALQRARPWFRTLVVSGRLPSRIRHAVTRDVYGINADGTGQKLLTDDGEGPAWAPDGSRIVFHSSRDDATVPPNNYELYAMTPDGTEPSRLTHTDSVMESGADWQPLGNSPLSASTTTTLGTEKNARRIRAFGKVRPAHPHLPVAITIYKKRTGKFRAITSKTPAVSATSRYSTSLLRPTSGACKIRSRFKGNGFHRASRVKRTFRC